MKRERPVVDTVLNGLLEAAVGKESQEEEDLALAFAVMEDTTSVGSADRVGSEVTKDPENG